MQREAVGDVEPPFYCPNNVGGSEDAQVLRHCLDGDAEHAGEIADGHAVFFLEELQRQESPPVRKRFQPALEECEVCHASILAARWHLVNYLTK